MDWMNAENQFIFQTYTRQPLVLVKAKGSFVWDNRGKKYLDFFSGLGVNNLGHCHPKVVKAVTRQVRSLIHTSNLYYTLPQIQTARELVNRTFPGKVFFSNSGAEANECAIKLARRWGRKMMGSESQSEIISFEKSFHGRSMGTLSLTGQENHRKGYDPLLERVLYAKFNDIDSVKNLLSDRTCSVFIEPVQGEGGVIPAEKSFLEQLRALCDRRQLLLIFDEVQSGLGRSGELFFFQYYRVLPDVLTVAKGLGGGLPIGACIAKPEVADLLSFGDHASTFGGNPVVCSASVEVLKSMNRTLFKAVNKKSEFLMRHLKDLAKKFPHVVQEVRGVGLMIGIVLKVPGKGHVDFCRGKGLLVNCTQEKVLRLLPSLTVSQAEMKFALDTLEKSFGREPCLSGETPAA